MNKRTYYALSVWALGLIILSTSCGDPTKKMIEMAQQQQLTVDPNPLELHGEEVAFTMSAKLPVEMMKQGTKYTLEVAYAPGTIEVIQDETPFEEITDLVKVGSISFDGAQYEGQTENPKVTKDFSFGYEDKYKMGGLMIKGIATRTKNNKSREFGPVRLVVQDGGYVKGVATTQRLVKRPTDGLRFSAGESPFAYGAHGYTGPVIENFDVTFNFEQGSATILPTTGSNRDQIESVTELYKDVEIPSFTASGSSSHSPEGREAINTKLAEDRANALETQFNRMMTLLDYNKEDMEKVEFSFEKKVLGETLPDFNRLVDGSSLSPEQKSEAKSIMSGDGDFVENERELQSKPFYRTLMSEVYPEMRYAKSSIRKPTAEKSFPEMKAMIAKMKQDSLEADALTEKEFLYAASQTPDLDERLDILMTAAKSYQTWAVHNNIGAILMDQALQKNDMSKVDAAIEQFTASMQKKETAEAAYNLAMAYSMKGDDANMQKFLEKAAGMTSANENTNKLINGAKGYLKIKQATARDDGNYKEAETVLNNATANNPNLYNRGLAQILQGVNYDAAISSLNAATLKNPSDGMTFYALAIAYARNNQESNMGEALGKAIKIDDNLKTWAMNDVEFDKFKNSDSFKNAIK